jgi:hypothetical protein
MPEVVCDIVMPEPPLVEPVDTASIAGGTADAGDVASHKPTRASSRTHKDLLLLPRFILNTFPV